MRGVFSMKKIEAVIRPGKLEEIKESLNKFNVHGLTISQVMGCGLQKGRKEYYRGTEVTLNLLPKIKIEIVTNDNSVDDIIKLICDEARTGEVGDGKIFIYNIEDTIRIRTGERGDKAI
jgi:nitrogen regulatory protein PII